MLTDKYDKQLPRLSIVSSYGARVYNASGEVKYGSIMKMLIYLGTKIAYGFRLKPMKFED